MTPPASDKTEMREPKFLGRFNFFSYTKDHWNIMFVPYHGMSTMIVAKNLTWEEKDILLQRLNSVLQQFEDEIRVEKG